MDGLRAAARKCCEHIRFNSTGPTTAGLLGTLSHAGFWGRASENTHTVTLELASLFESARGNDFVLGEESRESLGEGRYEGRHSCAFTCQ